MIWRGTPDTSPNCLRWMTSLAAWLLKTICTYSINFVCLSTPCDVPLLLTSLSPPPPRLLHFSVWTKTSAKFINNNNSTNCTRLFKSPLHTSPVTMTESPSHNGLHFSLPTKFSTCPSCLWKLKKRHFKCSTGPFRRKIKLVSPDGPWCPMFSVWRSRDHWTPAIWLRTLLGDYIPNMVLTPLEIVFNKLHPSILLHVTDATTQKVFILFLQEIKRDIIYRWVQLQEPHRREELYPRIQAHLVSVKNKISALLEYQGALQFSDGLAFLKRMSRVILQGWNSSFSALFFFRIT